MKDYLSQSHEEIKNAIKDYNKTFAILKTSQISSILKFQQVKAVSRVSSAVLKRQILSKSTITPNLSSYRIPSFHSQLSIIIKSHELKLKTLPTLILGPQPSLILNDSKGNLKLIDKKDILNIFLTLTNKDPVLILKSDSSKPQVIRNYNDFERNNKNFFRSPGILQHFMENMKIVPLLRAVVGKDGIYKLFILED